MGSVPGKEKILLHLLCNQTPIEGETSVPYRLSQKGIAESSDLSQNRTSVLLRRMIEQELIKEATRHVKGVSHKRKVYSLTSEGIKKAENIKDKWEKKSITVKSNRRNEECLLKDIDSYIDSRNPLLEAIKHLDGKNVLDLVQIKDKKEDVFAGRKKEIELLIDKLDIVKEGNCITALVKGRAGIGKTRLINEFKDTFLADDWRYLSGRGHYDTSEPYLPFKEAFDSLKEIDEKGPMIFTSIREENLNDIERKKPESRRKQIFSKTTSEIKSLAKDKPTIIFIDDLQWADRASLELFHYLSKGVEDAPLFFIGTYRPEEVSRKDFLNEVIGRMNRDGILTEIELKPLCWEETKEIIQGLLGKIDIPEYLVDIVHKTSQGNPLFSRELVKEMLENGTVDVKKNKYPSKLENIELPRAVKDIVRNKIKRLSDENLKILQIGSVIGEEVPYPLIKAVSGMNSADLLEYVDILIGLDIWTSERDENKFYFSHGLIRSGVYESIPGPIKEDLHKQVAKSIEEIFEDKVGEYYSDIAYHYELGKEFSKAFDYYTKGGKKAESVYAHEDAEEMYEKALELSEKSEIEEKKKWEVFEKLGDINKIKGRYEKSLDYYDKIPKTRPNTQYQQKIYRKVAGIHERQGKFNKAINFLDKGLKKNSKDKKNIETCRLLCRKGITEMRQGKYELAEEDLFRALDSYEDIGEERERADIHQWLGTVYLYKGEYEKGLDYLNEALKIWKNIGDLEGQASSLNNMGSIYLNQGELDKALDYYKMSIEKRKKMGDKRDIASTLNNIGTIYSKKGELNKALEHYQKSQEIWREIDDQKNIAVSLINIGEYHTKTGKLDLAIENYEEALDLFEKINSKKGLVLVNNNFGDVYRYKKNTDRAKKHYQRGLDLCDETGYKQLKVHLLTGLAELHLMEDNFDDALNIAKRAFEICQHSTTKIKKGICCKVLGSIYREKDEFEKAREKFEKGKRYLDDAGDKVKLSKLLYEETIFYRKTNEIDKAKRCLNEACSMFEEMKMKNWIEKCDEISL